MNGLEPLLAKKLSHGTKKIIKQRGRNEDTSIIQYWKSTGVAGKGGVIADKEFSVWIDWLIKDGQLKKRAN
ncbi:hypothetical protein GCM10020331_059290 [Ectobacillus funiculus]